MIVLNQEEKLDRQIYLKAKLLYPWASFHLIEFWEGYFKLLNLTSLFWLQECDVAGWLFLDSLGEGIVSHPPNKWLFKWEALLLLPPTISYAMSLFGISFNFTLDTFPEKAGICLRTVIMLGEFDGKSATRCCWSNCMRRVSFPDTCEKKLFGCIEGCQRARIE